MSWVEKDVDALGRVVIPIGFRKRLGIKCDSKVLMKLENGAVTIKSAYMLCALCNEKIDNEEKYRLCNACIALVRGKAQNNPD